KGQRKAKRIGTGPSGKKAAELAAIKLQAQLLEGVVSPSDGAPPPSAVTFEAYATQWLATHVVKCVSSVPHAFMQGTFDVMCFPCWVPSCSRPWAGLIVACSSTSAGRKGSVPRAWRISVVP